MISFSCLDAAVGIMSSFVYLFFSFALHNPWQFIKFIVDITTYSTCFFYSVSYCSLFLLILPIKTFMHIWWKLRRKMSINHIVNLFQGKKKKKLNTLHLMWRIIGINIFCISYRNFRLLNSDYACFLSHTSPERKKISVQLLYN